MAEAELQRRSASGGDAELAEDDDRSLHILLWHELERTSPLELVRLEAQDPPDGGTLVPDGAVGVEDRDDVERVLEEEAEEIVTSLEPLGDLAVLRHVLLHRDKVGDDPRPAMDEGDRLLLGVEAAVLSPVDEPPTPDPARPDGRPQLAVHLRILCAGLEDGDRAPDGFLRRETGQAREGRVDPGYNAVGIGDHMALAAAANAISWS